MAQPAPPPSPPAQASTSTAGVTHHKKHTRHHVKRRSTGRVHVTKLAPMARANSHNAHTDTEAEPDTDQQFKRPNVRRSQSQRSLHRLSSFERKGAGLTALAALEPNKNAATISPPTTPPPKRQQQQEEERPIPSVSSPAVLRKDEQHKPNFFVSHMAPAAPVEQTFNAVANNLVVPDNAALPAAIQQASPSKPASSQPVKKKHSPLRSQFVEDHHPRRPLSNVASAATAQPPGVTRTQQKVLLQRQQCLVDDENNLAHPRNMLRLTRELERVGNEYRCVRKFRDPMLESLARCMELRDSNNNSHQNDPQRLDTTQRTRSSSVLPSSTQADHSHNAVQQPHTEHRQAIRRRHMQLKMASTQPQSSLGSSSSPSSVQSTSTLGMLRWSAGAFLDRMWNGSSH